MLGWRHWTVEGRDVDAEDGGLAAYVWVGDGICPGAVELVELERGCVWRELVDGGGGWVEAV